MMENIKYKGIIIERIHLSGQMTNVEQFHNATRKGYPIGNIYGESKVMALLLLWQHI